MDMEYIAEISKLEIGKNEYGDYESKLCQMLEMVQNVKDFERTDGQVTGKNVEDLREDTVCRTDCVQNTCFSVPKVVE